MGSFIDFLRTALTAVSSLAASMPGLWNYVVDFAQLGTSAAASPVFLLAFAALAGASLVTFRVLSDLTFRQKGLSHVDAV